ncbi:hypothetical protein [Achromobacter aegrifaciens]
MDKLPNVVPASPRSLQSIPRQMSMTFDSVELQAMSTTQRSTVISVLASLLVQACGAFPVKEHNDDEQR